MTLLTFGASGGADCGTSKYSRRTETPVLHVPKFQKNTWPNHSKGGCPATTRLCMCKLHLFCRFRRWGFCCRGHGLCGSLDISQHTDSHSKSSATSGCLGYVWDKQPLAFPTASALGKAELPSCAQGHFQLCTMSVFGATTHLAIILNQSAGL